VPTPRRFTFALLAVTTVALTSGAAVTPQFIAYSLREASARAEAGETSKALASVGGITRFAGMVYHAKGKDVILVGLAAPDLPTARLDDLVVALRSRLVFNVFPLVSIDPVVDTEKTGLQRVRFSGPLENTSFGRDFLDADILLKKYSLHLAEAIRAIPTYNVLLEDDIREAVRRSGARVRDIRWLDAERGAVTSEKYESAAVETEEVYHDRFWFFATNYTAACADPEVFCIRELGIKVEAEDLGGRTAGSHTARDRFAQAWAAHYDRAAAAYPVLRRLKQFYDLVAIAEAVTKLEAQPYLGYLLRDYREAYVKTEPTYRLEELYGEVTRNDGRPQLVRIAGGIELRTEIAWLNDGKYSELHKLVLASRPSERALVWYPDLVGWRMPNTGDLGDGWDSGVATRIRWAGRSETTGGFALSAKSVVLAPPGARVDPVKVLRFSGFDLPPPPMELKGVSMHMDVDATAYRRDSAGKVNKAHKKATETRPSPNALTWPEQ